MEHISSEKKMELIRTIREENERNKGKMRNRESILFGGASSYQQQPSESAQEFRPVKSSFRLRLLLAIALFAGYLVMDMGKLDISGVTAEIVHAGINKSFSANLFDFIEDFPYTQKVDQAGTGQ